MDTQESAMVILKAIFSDNLFVSFTEMNRDQIIQIDQLSQVNLPIRGETSSNAPAHDIRSYYVWNTT